MSDPAPTAPGSGPPLLAAEAALEIGRDSGVPRQLAELNFFRLLLRRPRTAKAMSDLLVSLLAGEALGHRHRELAIMRIGWVTASAYEWTQHWRIAGQFGVPETDLLGVRDWPGHAGFDAADRAVLRAVDEAMGGAGISTATWAECDERLGTDAAIELVVAIGAWLMASIYLRATGVPLEEGVDAWPPTGSGPPDAGRKRPGRG